MKASTFKNSALEQQMEDNGYAIVPNFLNAEEVAFLKSYYESLHTKHDPNMNMWNSLWDVPPERRTEVSETILKVVQPHMKATFDNWKSPVGTFMSKCMGSQSNCTAHRDYSILEEDKYQYRNLWIPLVDINEQNGALYVFKGSHKVFTNILPMFNPWPYQKFVPQMMKYATVVYPKAGDLVVYRDKCLHGSFTNRSDNYRPVVHYGSLPSEAKLCYFYRDRENLDSPVEVYSVPEDFYFNHDFMKKPENQPLVKTFDMIDKQYSAEEFEAVMQKMTGIVPPQVIRQKAEAATEPKVAHQPNSTNGKTSQAGQKLDTKIDRQFERLI